MAMHHDFDATVIFTVDNFDKEQVMKLNVFFDDISEIKKSIVELKECSKVSVSFQSSDKDSFLEIKNIFTNQGEFIRINPNETRKLFEGQNRYSVLLPGDYLIRIFINGRYYYNVYSVQPRHISDLQLKNLREYLNKKINGLSYNLNTSLYKSKIKTNRFNINYLKIMDVCKKDFYILIKTLDDIIKNPITELKKNYIKGQNVKKQDIKTIRFSGKRNGGERLEIRKVPSVNSLENKILKGILISLLKEFRKIEMYLNELKNYILDDKNSILRKLNIDKKEIDFYYKDIKWIGNVLSKYINFFSEVDTCFKIIPVKNILKNPKYNKVYEIYKNFIDYVNYYEPNFKTTDVLYEYFTLIVLMEALEDMGFNLEDSDLKRLLSLRFVDLIPSGTSAVLTRDNIRLEVWYEKELKALYQEALKDDTYFYTHASNKLPDIRLDIYKDNKYIKSIIIEAKYRRFSYIWSDVENNETMIQIKNYKTTIHYISRELKRPILPIEKVIVVYPGQPDMDIIIEKEFGDYLFLQLRPGASLNEIVGYTELKMILTQLIE
ncbi:PD-(D/E)XK nuclease superfamily protein [Caloramator fervidus]|uniref:PD-(D/E)XK nuclease superfamily protein n=1 Tax=Caloramator fervidus TaxID=29344 RepID=A0A1H5X110_9CLOT|nr:nuclease domain-containing protein [Caloramator fervidus]SEG05070.1 PD-(D/E)XK nuclease superfamily protein [Caloramator fervidus]